MSIQKIAKYAKHFDLLVLQEEEIPLFLVETAKSLFRKVTARVLAHPSKTPIICHLLVVCGSSKWLKSPSLRAILSSVQRVETILLCTDELDVGVMKAALSLRAASVNDLPQNEEQFVNLMMGVFPHLIRRHNESVVSDYHRRIVEHSNHYFRIHKKGKSLYANEGFKKDFQVDTLGELDRHLDENELGKILNTPNFPQKVIQRSEKTGEWKEYFVTSHPLKEGEMLLSMVPLNAPLQSCEKRLLNRMNFIELLKDAYIIHQGENESIPVIVMHIENGEKIIEQNGEYTYNEICKGLFKLGQNYFGVDAQIAQWHKDVFTVISSGISVEELKEKLEQYHQEAALQVIIEEATPVLDSFVIDMHGVDLNKAISIIDRIHQKQLLSADLSNLVHHEISTVRRELDEKDQALYYLEKLMLAKTPVKLLNFYKGIRISTAARLVKLAEAQLYVAIEKIQGYAMKLEENTVIQASNLPFDIMAKVKIVDVGKKIAVLSHFEPLQASANNRQYIRIQSDHRMHVTINGGRNVMSGTIMDISIKSIACKVSSSKIPFAIGTSVTLQFNVPLARLEGEMVSMNIAGKVQYVQEQNDFSKVVVVLDLEEPYESYLIEYIYNRQQALVSEIKMIANKL